MARYVIEHDIEGIIHYYAGYQAESWADCGPIFNRTITEKARFTDDIVDMAIKQLTEMGYQVKKRMLMEKRKKAA